MPGKTKKFLKSQRLLRWLYFYKGGITVNNVQVIEVTPDKDGNVFITLYGTKYQIVVKEPKPSKTKQ